MPISLDKVIALMVLALSATSSFFAYSWLQKAEAYHESVIPAPQLGKAKYEFFVENKCFGTAASEITYDDTLAASFSGYINVITNPTKPAELVKIAGAVVSNTLNQLSSATFIITSSRGRHELLFTEINPIKVSVKLPFPSSLSNLALSIPGPILLQHEAGRGLILKSLAAGQKRNPFFDSLAKAVLAKTQNFDLEIRTAGSKESSCSETAIDAQKLIQQLIPTLPQFSGLPLEG